MNKRTLTLVVELDESMQSAWIWHSHYSRSFCYGVKVKSIAEGNCIKDDERPLKDQED